MSALDAPYPVRVGALISEELLRLLSENYSHPMPFDTTVPERELWEWNGQAKMLEFLKNARQQCLDYDRDTRLL